MHFEIYRETKGGIISLSQHGGGQWRWRLRAGNDKIVASGESYKNKADCLHAIELLKSTEPSTPVKETVE